MVDFRMAVVAYENAFRKLLSDILRAAVRQRTHVELERFPFRVMEGQGRQVLAVSANGTASSKLFYESDLLFESAEFLGLVSLMLSIFAKNRTKYRLPPLQRISANRTVRLFFHNCILIGPGLSVKGCRRSDSSVIIRQIRGNLRPKGHGNPEPSPKGKV